MIRKEKALARACALVLAATAGGAQAEATSSEQIAAAKAAAQASAAQTYTVMIALLEELVKSGVISLERAQQLLEHAERQATLARQTEAAPPPSSVRVPYVSETVKNQIRDELREEITQQARTERWGVPGAMPDWLSRFEWSGDFRLRYHQEDFDEGNFPYFPDVQKINDAGGVTTAGGFPFINSIEDRERMRYRARLNLSAKVTDGIKVGLSLAAGEDNGPISTNKTLGDYFRKDSVWLDRAYVEARLVDGLTFTGGRMPNPFFSTDLVWDADLNFEGAAFKGNHRFGGDDGPTVFGTVGAFPLQESALDSDRWLYAGQFGGSFNIVDSLSVKAGVAYYDFVHVQSKKNPPDGSRLNDYSKPPLIGQGNSVFNMRTDGLTTLAGLASEFELVDVVAQVEYRFDDKAVRFTADYVRNLAMDEDDIARLRGEPGVEPGDTGWQARLFFGHPTIAQRHQWNVEVGYKRLETDAVMDVFTDSDFGVVGGTDLKGYTFEANYGIAGNTWLSLKWLSADSISRPPFSSDVMILDLNTRF